MSKPVTVYYIKTYERDEEDLRWYETNNNFGHFSNFEKTKEAIEKDSGRKMGFGMSLDFGANRWVICQIDTINPEKYLAAQ